MQRIRDLRNDVMGGSGFLGGSDAFGRIDPVVFVVKCGAVRAIRKVKEGAVVYFYRITYHLTPPPAIHSVS